MESQAEERFHEAQLDTRISRAESAIEGLSADLLDEADAEYPGLLARVTKLLEYATAVVGGADPDLATPEMLNSVGSHIDGVRAQIDGWVESGSTTPLAEVQVQADALVEALRVWPYSTGIPPEEVREAASRFRRSAGQQLAALEAELSGLREGLTAAEQQVPRVVQAVEGAEAGFQSRLDELRTAVDQQRARLDQIVDQHQVQFSEAQERRVERFGEQTTELDARIAALETEAKDRTEELGARTSESAAALIASLEAELKRAQDIVGAIATTGIVGGYKTEAEAQAKAADRMRTGAIASLLGAVLVAVWAVVHAQANDASMTEVLAKALASLVFVGLAGYLANQSGRHRQREATARRREIELAAFGPFIQDLPDAERQKVVQELASRVFGRDGGQEDGINLNQENVGLLSQLLAALRGSSG